MSKAKTKTIHHTELYRAALSCKIGRDVLVEKTPAPPGASRMEYAVYSLLHAVEDVANYMMKVSGKEGKQ